MCLIVRGVHPPEAKTHFPLFQISTPAFQKDFWLCWKFFDFHPPKFLTTFFLSSITNFSYFQISPYFPCFSTFPLFRENYYFPPYFYKFPLFSKNSSVFFNSRVFTYFSCISFPACFDHARTGRPCSSCPPAFRFDRPLASLSQPVLVLCVALLPVWFVLMSNRQTTYCLSVSVLVWLVISSVSCTTLSVDSERTDCV